MDSITVGAAILAGVYAVIQILDRLYLPPRPVVADPGITAMLQQIVKAQEATLKLVDQLARSQMELHSSIRALGESMKHQMEIAKMRHQELERRFDDQESAIKRLLS